MRPGQIRAFVAGIVVGVGITTGTILVAAPARADAEAWAAEYGPAVCDRLAQHPTIAGLTVVLEDVAAAGYNTDRQSGELVAQSVFDVCPSFIPLLRQFVAMYWPRQVA